jgi:hypothetical protein
MHDIDIDMEKITDKNSIEKCIHGTNYSAWSLIKTQVNPNNYFSEINKFKIK